MFTGDFRGVSDNSGRHGSFRWFFRGVTMRFRGFIDRFKIVRGYLKGVQRNLRNLKRTLEVSRDIKRFLVLQKF